ncbi:FAD:protein FMN transferase [Konateibacter massiliensis]|uniref:FAD:protein FMN transferase n=1 Tax=Konateibacter massiliensis TaxID=2002841 RepID=UPI000C16024A|nr:FAD:protein FMN transferase [Konateibacter massiliensis]
MKALAKKIVSILLVMVLAVNMAACSGTKENRYEASFLELFDTVTKVVGYAKSEEEFTECTQLIYDELKSYHELYDIYNNYDGINNVKTINDNAGIEPVKVDQKIIDMLKIAIQAEKDTNGKKNIALGAVLSIWHDYRDRGLADPDNAKLPPMELLQEKAQHVNIDDVIIDEEASTVYLQDPEMSLDVGSIAKGYATEQVSQYIKEKGYEHLMISVGGNIKAIGTKLGDDGKEEPWSVGIQNPDMESENTNLYILNLEDYALVTSGVYQRYYVVDGQQYHHIIDPSTLMPADYFEAVSIVCEDSGMGDMLSTAIFNMPYEDGAKYIESLDGVEALWVFKDGSMKYSSGFEQFIKQ